MWTFFRERFRTWFQGENKDSVDHASWTGTRLWVLLGFIAFVIYISQGQIMEATLKYIFWGVVVYLICNTVTRMTQIIMNGLIIKDRQAKIWKDDKVTREEAQLLHETGP